MLAKLQIVVPFELTLPLGDQYNLYGYEEDGYRIFIDVPSASGKPRPLDAPEHVEINGKAALHADVITITFQKKTFERRIELPVDPPEALIQKALSSFIGRLKYASKAPQIKPIEFRGSQWHIQYLNDNGTELEQAEGYIRGRWAHNFSFSYIGCDPALWDLIFSLPEEFEAPGWHTLLVDSRGALPHIGTALVLAATALEIFIAELLDRLVKEGPVPLELWDWINDRGNWQKEPSVDEQYDILLKVMTGHSLKEDNNLWEGLKNLRAARNSFVHEGATKLGRATLSIMDTLQLIGKADAIVTKIRDWIPEHCRWPEIAHTVNMQFSKLIVGASNVPPSADAPPNDASVS